MERVLFIGSCSKILFLTIGDGGSRRSCIISLPIPRLADPERDVGCRECIETSLERDSQMVARAGRGEANGEGRVGIRISNDLCLFSFSLNLNKRRGKRKLRRKRNAPRFQNKFTDVPAALHLVGGLARLRARPELFHAAEGPVSEEVRKTVE